MRWLSLILIAIGSGHLILMQMNEGMKILRLFGNYQTVAAITLLVAGILIYLLTFMRPDSPTIDTGPAPDEPDDRS